jgi:AcrR family transcriptional regulator
VTTDTRELLILTAERLFAERGVGSVSLREILSEAGQRNKSAANYHFGNKQGLVEAVFRYRMGPVDVRRREMLASLDERGRGNEVRDLLQAYIYPLAERVGRPDGVSWYLRFVAQMFLSSDFDPFSAPYAAETAGLAVVAERLSRHLEHLPPELRDARMRSTFGLVVQAFAEHERRLGDGSATLPVPLLAAHLVDMAESLMRAPLSPTTELQMAQLQTGPPAGGGA